MKQTMMQVIEQTHDEKMAMYMKLPKKKLVEMLISCNDAIGVLSNPYKDDKRPLSEIIKSKLLELERDENKHTIKKEFSVSLEKLQDNPAEVMDTIRGYLKVNSDKIEDFSFTSYVNPVTFTPVLVMNILPVKDIRKYLVMDHWRELSDLDVTRFNVQDGVEDILARYAYENYTEEDKVVLLSELDTFLKKYTNIEFKIIFSEDESDIIVEYIDKDIEKVSLYVFVHSVLQKQK